MYETQVINKQKLKFSKGGNKPHTFKALEVDWIGSYQFQNTVFDFERQLHFSLFQLS